MDTGYGQHTQKSVTYVLKLDDILIVPRIKALDTASISTREMQGYDLSDHIALSSI
jgi:hypothetical protein